MIARHPTAQTGLSTALLDSGRILRASSAGDRLHIYSATCVQEISLGSAPARSCFCVRVDSWGDLAAVLVSCMWEQSALLFVDLAQHEVQHSVAFPRLAGHRLAQGARSAALAGPGGEGIRVLSCAGKDMGRELFRRPDRDAEISFDSLGKFLALPWVQQGVHMSPNHACVLDGVTGAALASVPALQLQRWLPDSSGLVIVHPDGAWCVLRCAASMQMAL